MGLAHFDEADSREVDLGHLKARWTLLGEAAGCLRVGVSRIELPPGGWSTPAHEHGSEEEIFYVLDGAGISWQDGEAAEVRAGDCIVYLAGGGAHTLHAVERLDVLAFGARHRAEAVGLPRLGLSLLAGRAVQSAPGVLDGSPVQFVREAGIGPPELPARPGPRPATIVNVRDVEPVVWERPRIASRRRNLGQAAGSVFTGLKHIEVPAGRLATPLHCHSLEEEIFVILRGEGTLLLDDREVPVRAGHVVCRPAGTGVAHALRAGDSELTFLAYGTREPGDLCYYPSSSKLSFRGLGVIVRVQPLDYWDGE